MIRIFRTRPFATVWMVGLLQEAAFVLLVNLPGRFHEFGISETGIGLAYSLAAASALAVRPSFGRVLDVTHRRSVLRSLGLLHVGAVIILAVVDSANPLMWAAFLTQRVAQILLLTTLLTYAADVVPKEVRTEGLALFGLSGLVPIAFSNLVGESLVSGTNHSALIGIAAGAAAASWLLVWRLPTLPVLGTRPRRSFWSVVRQPDMLPLWLITLMFGMGMETLRTFTRTYVDERGIGTVGLFFAVYGGAAVVARLGGGRSYDRLPHRSLTVTAILVQATGMFATAFATGVPLLLVGAGLTGLAHGTVFPLLSSQVVNRSRTAERGSAVATFTSVLDLGLLVVAPMVGAAIDWAGYTFGYVLVGITLTAGAAVYGIWDRRLVTAPV